MFAILPARLGDVEESVGWTAKVLVVLFLVVLAVFVSGEEPAVAVAWVWQEDSVSLEKTDAQALARTVLRGELGEMGEMEAERLALPVTEEALESSLALTVAMALPVETPRLLRREVPAQAGAHAQAREHERA